MTVGHLPGGRLSLLSARPAVAFPVAEHYRPLAGTKLYCLCLVTEAYGCEQLAQGCYAALLRVGFIPTICSSQAQLVYCEEMAEPIEMPFGKPVHVGQRNHVLDGVQIHQGERAIFGVVWPVKKHWESLLWTWCMQQKKISRGMSVTAAANCIAPDWLTSH